MTLKLSERAAHTINEWGIQRGLDALSIIKAHFVELFPDGELEVIEANETDGNLIVRTRAASWAGVREFALLESGQLMW